MDRSLRGITTDARGDVWGVTINGRLLRIPHDATHSPEGTQIEIVNSSAPSKRVPPRRSFVTATKTGIRYGTPEGVAEISLPPSSPPSPPRHLMTVGQENATLTADRSGTIWLARDGGTLESLADDGTLRLHTRIVPETIERVMIARNGSVWMRGRNWLQCWTGTTLRKWPLRPEFTLGSAYESMLEDRQGAIWLGGRGGLIRLFQNQLTELSFSKDQAENPVTSLFEDREGNIWVGTLKGVLIRVRDSAITWTGSSENLVGDITNSILVEPDGDVWTHSMGRGLTHWSGDRLRAIPFHHGNLWFMAREPNSGALYFGSGGRNFRLENNRPVPVRDPAPELGAISGWWAGPASGGLYVSRATGLYWQPQLDQVNGARKLSSQGRWQFLATGPPGHLFGSDFYRLVHWTTNGETVHWAPNRHVDELIYCLFWDPASARLWVGTNRGLLSFDPATNHWGARGLIEDSIFALQRDQFGTIWAATRNGIVSISANNWLAGQTLASLRLTRADGLRSLNFGMSRGQGAALLADGRVLFASLQGVATLDPTRIRKPVYGPTPIIGEVLADDVPQPLLQPANIAPGTSSIKISFDAFSASSLQPVLVEYLLEGVDTHWQTAATRRSVQYNNLLPGRYRFRVRAQWPDRSGASETQVDWRILPHFYETIWFRSSLALGTLALFLYWLRHRSNAQARLTAELEARVLERTQELESAREAAEAGARVKAEFLATMSHELRTPMNGVLGIAELLDGTPLDAEQRELLSTLRTSGESMLAVLNDILDLSKFDSGHFQLERIPIRIDGLLADAINLVRPLADKKKLALVQASQGVAASEWILGDPARIRQILLNLLGNAIKFTPTGQITVTSTWHSDHLVLTVADTGIGIAADKLPQLFQNFVQVDSSTTRLYGGTGLGLAISRRLVEAMGGSITCESRPGVGSTFSFQLPITPASPPAPLIPSAAATTQSGLRILVAEDNATNQRVILGLLSRLGITAVLANNGLEAVDACQRTTFDLVLMDCQMPVLDGYGATRAIHHNLGAQAPPIVALTAHALESDRAECLAAGMCGYLTKPIVLDQLRQVIADLPNAAGSGPPANPAVHTEIQ
jgi:signal transduction histidine kinase/CheY-like chemotaxis protein